MLTQEKIDQFYKDVMALDIKKRNSVIAKKTGYSAGNVSDFINKKKPVSENFIEKYYQHFPKHSKNVPRGNEATEEEEPGDLALATINNLSQSNIILARSHEELVLMLKKERAIVYGQREIEPNDLSTNQDFLELLVDLGVKTKKWHSKEEAIAALSNVFYGDKKAKT